jgi:hypothetical protein
VNSDKNAAFTFAGAVVVPFTASAPDASSALVGIDVVICTLSPFANDVQFDAVRACAAGGVKLFIPCDWGSRIWDREEPFNKRQQAVHAAAADAGLKTASFFCGFWPEYFPHFGWDLEQGRITIWGDGETEGSLTSKPDVARFVAHALTTFPAVTLEGGEFAIEGDHIVSGPVPKTLLCLSDTSSQSALALAQELKAASKRPLEITTTGQQYLIDRIAKNEWDVTAQVALAFDDVRTARHAACANDLWPDWKPRKAIEVLRELLPQ